jgi:NAD(P)H-hydrate epimerase
MSWVKAMKVATAESIRELDRRAIEEFGISGAVLMENAGRGTARVILDRFPDAAKQGVVIVCGRGNNGGDGFVIARHLSNRGVGVAVFIVGEAKTVREGEARINLDILHRMGTGTMEVTTDDDLLALRKSFCECGVIIDALFGTGLAREVSGMNARAISAMHSARETGNVSILSVDIPSGINTDTGKVLGTAVQADVTVTFALPKVGALIYPGAEHVGEHIVLDISIPHTLVDEMKSDYFLLSGETVWPLFKKRKPDAHKGTFGHLLIISGSPGKTGAAALAADGALRAGAGLVTVGVPKSLNPILEMKLTEAMTLPLPDEDGHLSSEAFDAIMDEVERRTAIALGPGLGTSKGAREVVRGLIAESPVPLVIDADGLNVIACDADILKNKNSEIILTPHPGEMGRLIGKASREVQADRIGAVKHLSGLYGVWVVLKGARTLIASPTGEITIATGGNPGMASGGSGDILTGLIGGFLAGTKNPFKSSAAGVYIHAAAGDRANEHIGETSLIATDILKEIPAIILALQKKSASHREKSGDFYTTI